MLGVYIGSDFRSTGRGILKRTHLAFQERFARSGGCSKRFVFEDLVFEALSFEMLEKKAEEPVAIGVASAVANLWGMRRSCFSVAEGSAPIAGSYDLEDRNCQRFGRKSARWTPSSMAFAMTRSGR